MAELQSHAIGLPTPPQTPAFASFPTIDQSVVKMPQACVTVSIESSATAGFQEQLAHVTESERSTYRARPQLDGFEWMQEPADPSQVSNASDSIMLGDLST